MSTVFHHSLFTLFPFSPPLTLPFLSPLTPILALLSRIMIIIRYSLSINYILLNDFDSSGFSSKVKF